MLLHHLQLTGAIHTHHLLLSFILPLLLGVQIWVTCSFPPRRTQGPWNPPPVVPICLPLLQVRVVSR
ncbi:hypothetical protein LUU34_00268100 [Aix galericulata]|nr:hypothetical protein LUU34_00268100 [Aix galericulata]